MGRLADTVIKEMDKKMLDEEAKTRHYEQQKELRDRMRDEERLRKLKQQQ